MLNQCIWGSISKRRLDTCHTKLRILFYELIRWLPREMDTTILCGHRDRDAQNEAYHDGNSTKEWPDSKHNIIPSLAIDAAPWRIAWRDSLRFARLTGFIKAVCIYVNECIETGNLDGLCIEARSLIPTPHIGQSNYIQIRCGDDWDQDGRSDDEKFIDQPHVELMNP